MNAKMTLPRKVAKKINGIHQFLRTLIRLFQCKNYPEEIEKLV